MFVSYMTMQIKILDNEVSIADIRKELLANMPKYALPTSYYCVKELPRNANGKIDRQLLKKEYIGD